MKPSRINEYREMSIEELEKELENTRAKLFSQKCQRIVGGGISNYRTLRDLRREIARINTVITAKK